VIMRILILVLTRLGKFFLRIMLGIDHGLPFRIGIMFVGVGASLGALCQGLPARVLYKHEMVRGVKQKIR
jgi:hypothetical protein